MREGLGLGPFISRPKLVKPVLIKAELQGFVHVLEPLGEQRGRAPHRPGPRREVMT